ncbi:uncharacterized protein LOC105842441 isoform X2 [Bombyx mori]|uniref:uncharacterized protein LOC105842441 isoform X2 n=1 Tax=Bombyx mori TaxID=7091 RepID=UPI002ED36B91
MHACVHQIHDTVREFQDTWADVQRPLENAIVSALKESYGYRGMNVFVRKTRDLHSIATGYYHNDIQVRLLLSNLDLENLPYLWMPQVTFLLPDNVLKINASLSKMIVRCKYTVFRNTTDMIYDANEQDSNLNSPFRFQQVQNTGDLAISIEACVLSGFVMTMLDGPSVNLGLSSLELSKCRFSFEIYKQGLGTPPVLANYDLTNNGLNILNLLTIPLREELMPKLQAAMFSYVNTTAIFGDNLANIRRKQEGLLRTSWLYMADVVRNLNKVTLQENLGNIEMTDFDITWKETSSNSQQNRTFNQIRLSKMVLSGLETAYLSQTGGPYRFPNFELREQIRLSSLLVNGHIRYTGSDEADYDFSVEITDLCVDVTIDVSHTKKRKSSTKGVQNVVVTGWRSAVFSIPTIVPFPHTEALVIGYMYNTVPKYVVNVLVNGLDRALYYTETNQVLNFSLYENNENSEHDNEHVHTTEKVLSGGLNFWHEYASYYQ